MALRKIDEKAWNIIAATFEGDAASLSESGAAMAAANAAIFSEGALCFAQLNKKPSLNNQRGPVRFDGLHCYVGL